ncbi:hypothetical protein BH10PLA2_BH10PLA2_29250 [soil metagenome]
MVAPSAGEVVLVPFPFSDLSQSKVRLAVCLADAGRGDWVLCQITSSPYGDSSAVALDASDFASGGLLGRSNGSECRPDRKAVHSPLRIAYSVSRRPEARDPCTRPICCGFVVSLPE